MYSLVRQSGQLPDGFAGENVFKEKLGQCKTALRLLKERGIRPVSAQLEIDAQAASVRIQDVLSTYLEGELLDISPSSLSGALLIQTWIRHLAWSLSSGSKMKSSLLCEIKDSGPKWVEYRPVKSPEKLLMPFLEQYKIGRCEPLLFFPKTLYTYVDTERNSSYKDPLEEATSEFEGDDWKMGERMNINLKAVLGADASFKPDYVEEPFRSLISTMMDHMEVKK
jgi:exonuclease V gamma subunit